MSRTSRHATSPPPSSATGSAPWSCGHRRSLGPVYPLPEILRRARAMGIGVTLGDDSHGPATVGGALDECMRVIAAAGYTRVHYLVREDGAVVPRSAPLEDVRPQSR